MMNEAMIAEAVKKAMAELNTDDKNEISIAREQAVFLLIYKIQEEVHRYTVAKMTGAKRKLLKSSVLENIKGIGPVKAKKLLMNFKGLSGVASATEAELMSVNGITNKDAVSIREYFNKNNLGKK